MPRFIECEQGTEAWHMARAGYATASRFYDILAGGKARESYMWELVAERLSGGPMRASGSKSMDWGHGAEPLAREEYQIQTGDFVQQAGFAIHSSIKWVGASTDGLVGAPGSVEIKSPFNSGIHARTLAIGMPEGHHPQTQGNLWVLEREWIDFCSYDPSYPSPLNLYRQRFFRDEPFIKHLELEVKKFLAEVAVQVKKIKSTYH